MPFVYAAIVALWWFLDPTPAYAWGPGTHLEIALTVLKHTAWVAPAVRQLMANYPAEFIYGNVSPDIILGKKYAGPKFHCHNWAIGKLILEEALNDGDRAAAWGYLTHLAADCVAHNYFVPQKIIQSYPHRTLGHAYWEMRFDLHVPDACWKQLGTVIHHDYHSFDYLLERVLKKTLFSFRTNKKIFNSILILHRMKRLRFGLRTYAKASQWALRPGDVRHFRELTLETVKDFLSHPKSARCLKADPAGIRKLQYAFEMEKEMRKKLRQGETPKQKLTQSAEKMELALEKGLFDSSMALPVL